MKKMQVTPTTVKALTKVGEVAEKAGFQKGASFAYQMGLKVNEGLAAFRIGNQHYLNEEYREAVASLRKAVELKSGGAEAVRRLIISEYRLGEKVSAVNRLKNALNSNQLSVRDKTVISSAEWEFDAEDKLSNIEHNLYKEKLWQKADRLKSEESIRKSDPEWCYKYAKLLEDCGRYESAVEWYELAFTLKESSWWAYRAGIAYYRMGEVQASRKWFRIAVDLDNKFDAKRFGIAPFHEEHNQFDLAARAYEERFVQAKSGAGDSQLVLRAARNYGRILDFGSATRLYKQYLQFVPDSASAFFEFVDVLLAARNFDYARRVLDSISFEELSDVEKGQFNYALGLCEYFDGDSSLASKYFCNYLRYESESSGKCSEEQRVWTSGQEGGGDLPIFLSQLADELSDKGVEVAWRWVATFQRFGDLQSAYALGRKACLASGLVSVENANIFAGILFELGKYDEIFRLVSETRRFIFPSFWGMFVPAQDSYDDYLRYYADWSDYLPVESNVILYESNLALSIDCNPLSICKSLMSSSDEYIHIWAVKDDENVPSELLNSPKVVIVKKDSLAYVKALATAGYLINNSTFPTYFVRRSNQKYLMTWHGTPLKTLAKDQPEPMTHANMSRNYLQASHALFPNEHTYKVLVEHGDIDGLTHCDFRLTGYPRNDELVDSKDFPRQQKPVAFYAPTWREDHELEDQVFSLLKVQNALESAGFEVKLRTHHYVEAKAKAINPDLGFVDRSISSYTVMAEADLLVTDFSSIYFDFAVTGRPMVFYVPDWEQYDESRGVYFDRSHLPGQVCSDIGEFADAIANIDLSTQINEEFLTEFAPLDDGKATERVIKWFFHDIDGDSVKLGNADSGRPRVLLRQSFIPNGMASSFLNLCDGLVESGVEVLALTPANSLKLETGRQSTLASLNPDVKVIGRIGKIVENSLEYHSDRVQSKLISLGCEPISNVYQKAFTREARRILPDVRLNAAIEFDGYSYFMARLVLEFGEDETVHGIYVHNDLIAEANLRVPELWNVVGILEKFDKVTAVSKQLMEVNIDKIERSRGISVSNFEFIENYIVPQKILDKSQLDSELPGFEPEQETYFVHVGRFSPEKNQKFAIEAFKEIALEFPKSKLLLLGDGPSREEIESFVKDQGLEKSVILGGWVSNPFPFIKASKGLLLPSLHEGQPMVILEANTLGVPSLCSDIAAVRGMEHLSNFQILSWDKAEWAYHMREVLNGRSPEIEFDAFAYAQSALEQFVRAYKLIS